MLTENYRDFMRKQSFEYQHYNHSVGLAIVHFVFVPKRRKPVLKGEIRNRLYQIWQELALEKKWNIRALEIAPEHVHLFVEIHPTDPIHLVVKAFKGRSSNYLRKEFPELKNFRAYGAKVISLVPLAMLVLILFRNILKILTTGKIE